MAGWEFGLECEAEWFPGSWMSHQRCAGWPQGLSLLVSDGRVVGRGAALSAWSLCGYWCFEGLGWY